MVISLLVLSGMGVQAEPNTVEMLTKLLQGSPDRDRLETIMNQVVVKYGMSPTEESRRKLGNVLIAMQKKIGISGFEELTCMQDLTLRMATEMPEVRPRLRA